LSLTGPIGFGLCPCGEVPGGYGEPAFVSALVAPSPADARYIDPLARDYVLDVNGNLETMSSVAQQVYLALLTTQGSAAINTLGSALRNQATIGSNFQQLAQEQVASALSTLIKSGTVSLLSVSASLFPNDAGLNLTVTWLDNTTSSINTTTIV
jgi:phage gp46-like protein